MGLEYYSNDKRKDLKRYLFILSLLLSNIKKLPLSHVNVAL